MPREGSDRLWTLSDYVAVLRRQKLFVLGAVVLVPVLALVMSLRQQKLYEASAQVLLSNENLAASLTGQSSSRPDQSDRIVATDAKLARVTPVLEHVLQVVPVKGLTVSGLRDHSRVSADTSTNLLTFNVTIQDPEAARRLASEYARQFTLYQRQLDSLPLARALRAVESRLRQLPAGGGSQRTLYESLINKQQQLRAMEALGSANTFVVQNADAASQVQPRPIRSAALGFGLGLLIGLALAFLVEALDRRVRGHEEIEERLGLPLLARLRAPDRHLREHGRLAMLRDPHGVQAEAFRLFRSNVELANLRHRAKTFMVASALPGEGKTTTAANLAVAFAQHGRRVILVDLDLRRPSIHLMLELDRQPGITDVTLGNATLDDALVEVSVEGVSPRETRGGAGRRGNGTLLVLPSGSVPADPGSLVGTDELRQILAELRSRADLVLIDTPPLLQVGEALSLSAEVDAMLVVTNIRTVTRPVLKELARVLEMCPAAKLGFALTSATVQETYRYAYRARERPVAGATDHKEVIERPVSIEKLDGPVDEPHPLAQARQRSAKSRRESL